MLPIHQTRHANLLRLLARYPTIQAFADAIERPHSQVSQLKNRSKHSSSGEPRVVGEDIARHIEEKLGLPLGWMDTPNAGLETAGRGPSSGGDAVPVLPVTHSTRVIWGAQKMGTQLPTTFSVEVPDDSMAPRVRRGDVVRFTQGLTPRPGDGILVVDAAGNWYFRVYRERRPGQWGAYPMNDAYQPMDAEADGLQLLAVLTGIESQRWG